MSGDDPLSINIDEARYSASLAADLCEAFALACAGMPEPQRTGLLAIHRALDNRIDGVVALLDTAFTQAQAIEAQVVRS
jgi:hypothetical protein